MLKNNFSFIEVDSNQLYSILQKAKKIIIQKENEEKNRFFQKQYEIQTKSIWNKIFPQTFEQFINKYENYYRDDSSLFCFIPKNIELYLLIKEKYLKELIKVAEIESLTKFQDVVILTASDGFFLVKLVGEQIKGRVRGYRI